MSAILKKFSLANLYSGENKDSFKAEREPSRTTSLRNAFTRSLDSISKSIKKTLQRSKSEKSLSDIDTDKGDAQYKHAGNGNSMKSSSRREIGIGGLMGFKKLGSLRPTYRQETENKLRPKFDPDDKNFPKMVYSKPKNNEFLLISTKYDSEVKPKTFFAKESAKTLTPVSSFKDNDTSCVTEKDIHPEPDAAADLDLNPENSETRKKALADLVNGTTKLSPHFTTRYILGDMLGDGAFGFVFTAKRIIDSVEVAVKFIIRSKISKSNWVDHGLGEIPCEVDTLQKLHHPNIIKYIEHIFEKDYVLLITELFGTSWDASNLELDPANNPGLKFRFHKDVEENGNVVVKSRTSCDLFECIDAHTRIPISKAKYLFAQIVLACDYLQSMNLVHRDIKDENIVVNSKYEIKLIDFGSASPIPTRPQDYFSRYNGTPHFAAPEIAAGNSYQGPQAEVWTLGVLLYTIIFGENPFQNKSDILAYNGALTYPRFIESELKKLLESMLCINVRRRITLENVKSHPWCSFQISFLKKLYDEKESQLN